MQNHPCTVLTHLECSSNTCDPVPPCCCLPTTPTTPPPPAPPPPTLARSEGVGGLVGGLERLGVLPLGGSREAEAGRSCMVGSFFSAVRGLHMKCKVWGQSVSMRDASTWASLEEYS
eukprot:1156478-Pelagomonas_calceolata.AAC.2